MRFQDIIFESFAASAHRKYKELEMQKMEHEEYAEPVPNFKLPFLKFAEIVENAKRAISRLKTMGTV